LLLSRNPHHGTWFVQSFCNVFKEHAYNKDLFELLDLVKQDLDKNPKYRDNLKVDNKTIEVKQNCVWSKSSNDDKKIYFVSKPKNF
jgi:hypothetical protein